MISTVRTSMAEQALEYLEGRTLFDPEAVELQTRIQALFPARNTRLVLMETYFSTIHGSVLEAIFRQEFNEVLTALNNLN